MDKIKVVSWLPDDANTTNKNNHIRQAQSKFNSVHIHQRVALLNQATPHIDKINKSIAESKWGNDGKKSENESFKK